MDRRNDSKDLAPFRLRPFFSERVWGRQSLSPWFTSTHTSKPVGEAWLTGPQCVVESGPLAGNTLETVARRHSRELLSSDTEQEFPLLVKLLFPNDKLSVQVHPDDARAQAMGQPRGKTECWYVLEAEPDAAVALGLMEGTGPDDIRKAIAAGTLEQMLEQVPVSAGDMIFVDAGTVHAIGPGVVLLETQQTSDTTFRMWDYGRPRELHVDQGIAATKFQTRAGKVAPRALQPGATRLIEEQYFTVDRFDPPSSEAVSVRFAGPGCLVGLAGTSSVSFGTGQETTLDLSRADAMVVPAGCEVTVRSLEAGAAFARCMAPAT